VTEAETAVGAAGATTIKFFFKLTLDENVENELNIFI
jgi:hypothetical protein